MKLKSRTLIHRIALFCFVLLHASGSVSKADDCRIHLSRYPNHLQFYQEFPDGLAERYDQEFRRLMETQRGLYVDLESAVPGFKLYHGTWTRSNVQGILAGGFVPQSGGQIFRSGTPYRGIFAVARPDIHFTRDFIDQDAGGAVIEIEIDPAAKLVDFRRPAIEAFVEDHFESNYSRFFEEVPVDLFIYDYPTRDGETLMVIRNSKVIRSIQELGPGQF